MISSDCPDYPAVGVSFNKAILMAKIIFHGWEIGMRPLAFYYFLHEKTNLTLREAREIRLKISENEVVELEVQDPEIANEILEKSLEFGVKAGIEI